MYISVINNGGGGFVLIRSVEYIQTIHKISRRKSRYDLYKFVKLYTDDSNLSGLL